MASAVVRGLGEHGGISGILRGGEGVVSPHDAETGAVGGAGLDCSSERAHLDPVRSTTVMRTRDWDACHKNS